MLATSQVEKGVDALLGLMKAASKTVSITDQPEKVDVQFTMKKIPRIKHKTIPLSLPNSIHFDTREVCIFVKDVDQKKREYEETVEHYEDLFKKNGIASIAKIVPVKALRTDFCMPSTRRSLAKAYDLYLVDKRVMGLMPNLLGKIFFAQKKTLPVHVDITHVHLKKMIDAAINNSRCIMQGAGSSCSATVANDRMSRAEIVDNVLSAVNQLAEKVPGGSANMRNIYIKSAGSPAVPLFIDFGAPSEVKMPRVKQQKLAEYVDEITTVENAKVSVRADGIVKVIRDVTEEEEGDDDDAQITDQQKSRKRKRPSKKQTVPNKKKRTSRKVKKSK